MKLALLVITLLLSTTAFGTEPQLSAANELGGAGGVGLPSIPNETEDGFWAVATDVFKTTSAVTYTAFAVMPEDMAHLTSVGLANAHLPLNLHCSLNCILFSAKNMAYGAYDALLELSHWAALPIYYMRHLLKGMPVPSLPWESSQPSQSTPLQLAMTV